MMMKEVYNIKVGFATSQEKTLYRDQFDVPNKPNKKNIKSMVLDILESKNKMKCKIAFIFLCNENDDIIFSLGDRYTLKLLDAGDKKAMKMTLLK
jgi:hypothetical protein